MTNLPIPSHLEGFLNVNIKKSNEKQLVASLVCCGEEYFKIYTQNSDLVCKIKTICQKCNKEIIVFDNRFHGWDGFVCHLFRNEKEGELVEIYCEKCNKNTFKTFITIISEGKQDFIEEACDEFVEEAQRTFSPDEWINGFSWISIKIKCSGCGKSKKLINYETM